MHAQQKHLLAVIYKQLILDFRRNGWRWTWTTYIWHFFSI